MAPLPLVEARNTIISNLVLDLVVMGLLFMFLPDQMIVHKWTMLAMFAIILTITSAAGLLLAERRQHSFKGPPL